MIIAAALVVCVQSAAMDVQRRTIEREPFPAEDTLDHERVENDRIGALVEIGLNDFSQQPFTRDAFGLSVTGLPVRRHDGLELGRR